ncbi:MAG: M3 family oligoendopeptidase [Oscillochloridaceae bacterium]|nr:M3 family oligoendopeptidase [Chloroflexaceae bacterium]MDW8391295.1 M3 family oligoendopeptidase [Oscillochloridaceae bacterium]
MLRDLPTSAQTTLDWSWEHWQPFYAELEAAPIVEPAAWLAAWSRLADLLAETYTRLSVATTCDTADAAAEARFRAFLGDVYPRAMAADQALKRKFLDAGFEPEGFAVPLRNLRAEVELFREANLPLLTEERRLGNEYNRIIGAQTIEWAGRELTIPQTEPLLEEPDRAVREEVWRRAAARQLADREAINQIWRQLLALRRQLAANAGLPDYRAYAWRLRQRFDYTPDDCLRFHEAIEAVAVPAARRVYARRAARLGLDRLRPWDTHARASGEAPLRPFRDGVELAERGEAVLTRVDPELGGYFAIMRQEGFLDLDNRKGKAPGGYCVYFPVARRPFIFMNAVGMPGDVRTLLHEAGHAFHDFEMAHLPYHQQREVPIEFAEVASMAMELLAAPYLRRADGGYYDQAEYARARIEHLEGILTFWPYMAVVDGFQHWAYTNPEAADNPAACDAAWDQLWARFMDGVDWSGLDAERITGWHRKQHIYRYPFYYVEYGLAQLGAVQVWRNALSDQAGAVAAYRRALARGGVATLPDLFETAGARFVFDSDALREAVELIEEEIARLAQHV